VSPERKALVGSRICEERPISKIAHIDLRTLAWLITMACRFTTFRILQ
jgi:hypothetical protein